MAKGYECCAKCGQALQINSWPWCPHGTGANAAFPDDIPGGLVMEHIFPGRKVYSKSELKRVIGAAGYMIDDTKTEKDFAKVLKDARDRAGDTRSSQEQ